MHRSILDALEAAAAAEPGRPSCSELMRRIMVEWLAERGYLRSSKSDQGIRPDQLTSENDG
jgi:hypothetical protein